jgi:hypothetical protein
MAVEKAALRITELDFISIRENLKTFLRSQNEFQDFDWEGSGLAVLLDILAYNTHYMGYYLNMVGNEMFLDTAQIRASVLSHAKAINYIPGSKQGALSKVNITVTPTITEDTEASSLTLEKYTRLLGYDKDGVNYPFVTIYSNTATKQAGSFQFSNVYIKQGEVVTLQYLADSTNDKRRYEIPSANVDTTSISVRVQESNSNTDTKLYSLASDITTLTQNSKVYFIEENENLNYTLYFGDDVIGKRPKDGNIIICTYLDNVGSQSNNITGFTFTDYIGGKYRNNVRTTSTVSSYGGVDKETIEEVRYRAPYFYSTQNRAVTVNDYETLILKDYPIIESVSVWGGQDNDPVIYGKVFLSLKTKSNYYLTNFEKENIKQSLIETRNILTVTPEIVDPDYVYLQVKGTVKYDSQLTSLTANEILAYAKAAIFDYSDMELNKFGSIFRKSKLQNYIENSEQSITASDIDVFVQKRMLVDTNRKRNYTVAFNMPLKQVSHKDKLVTYPRIEVYDSANISRNVYFEEVPEALSGISSITITNSGINYSSAPTVTITGDGYGATAKATVAGGRVTDIEITNSGTDYSYAIVSLDGGDGYGAIAIPVLDSDVGYLRSYYYKSTGEKVVVNSNAGSINYLTGQIILNSLRAYSVEENAFYDQDYLTFNIMAENDIIEPLRNRILTIDQEDPKSIQINVVSE